MNDTYNPIFKILHELYTNTHTHTYTIHKYTHTRGVIEAGLGTLNIHNIYIHRPISNTTTQAR
jgi:hypothetical protein